MPESPLAAANGIVGGYGDGRFGPNDNITREQLAVMLWRYAGSSAATDKELHFTDTDQASGYALEAIRWAAENGVLNGYGDGRLGPQGHATRAQVAQMLKNQLSAWVRLKFAAFNRKKLALWWTRYSFPHLLFTSISLVFSPFPCQGQGVLFLHGVVLVADLMELAPGGVAQLLQQQLVKAQLGALRRQTGHILPGQLLLRFQPVPGLAVIPHVAVGLTDGGFLHVGEGVVAVVEDVEPGYGPPNPRTSSGTTAWRSCPPCPPTGRP